MSEILTMEEIEAKYDQEWVLLEDPEVTESEEIRSAKVVWHSKDEAEIWRKAGELRPVRPEILFIGEPPEDLEFLL